MKFKALRDHLVKNPPSIGQFIQGLDVYSFGGQSWMHIYEILAEPQKLERFGTPDLLLTVRITTTHGTVVDHKIRRWASQLF